MIYVPDSNPSLFERYNFNFFFVDKMAFAFYSNKTVNIKFLHMLYNDDAIRGHSITTYLDKKRYIEYSCLVMWTKGR